MQLEINCHHVPLDPSLKDHVSRQMEFALGQFDGWISKVLVHLEDVNGPRGGVDKQCRVLVTLRGGKTLKIEDLDADLISVINRSADRIGHAVSREMDRRRERKGSTSMGEAPEESLGPHEE